jgi:hypothetical protein
MQREQRQALDRQLNTQAYYAAETGVNDVYASLLAGTLTDSEKDECSVENWPTNGANGVIDSNEPGISYTCITYDKSPSTLEFNNGAISTQQSKIIPIQSENGGNVQTITFEWSGANGQKIVTGDCSNEFPASRPNAVPVLRLDLLPLPTGSGVARNTISDDTLHMYLYPQLDISCSSNSTPYTSHDGLDEKGLIVPVTCNPANNYSCSLTITDINTAKPSNKFFIRVKSIYDNADLKISATSDNGAQFEFVDAQIEVDSTGKATDVLRRIKVNLSIYETYPIPEAVFQSMNGVCKRLSIAPGDGANIIADYDCFN